MHLGLNLVLLCQLMLGWWEVEETIFQKICINRCFLHKMPWACLRSGARYWESDMGDSWLTNTAES